MLINMSNGSITTEGENANGLAGAHATGTAGAVTIDVTGGSISTTTASSLGVSATRTGGTGEVTVGVSQAISDVETEVKTAGANAHGVNASNRGLGNASIAMQGGLVETTGAGARGLGPIPDIRGRATQTRLSILQAARSARRAESASTLSSPMELSSNAVAGAAKPGWA